MVIIIYVFVLILIYFLANKLTYGRIQSGRCLVNRTALITGGNSGIGYEVALNLASRGCRVIIADKENCEQSCGKIIKLTTNLNVIWKQFDLASFKSIRKFATEINLQEDRLDILVNNAGVATFADKITEDGFNMMMQVNYLGPFLLTHLLLGLLKESAPSRIIFTSSAIAFLGNLHTFDVYKTMNSSISSCFKIYGDSKLATIVASDYLAQKLGPHGITSNSLHPGFVHSKLFQLTKKQQFSWFYTMQHFTSRIFGKSSWEGAQTTLPLATSNIVTTNEHYWDCKHFYKPSQAKNEVLCHKIWKASEEYVQLTCDETISNFI